MLNVSTHNLTHDERKFVGNLVVKPKPLVQHGNGKASAWTYFGLCVMQTGYALMRTECIASCV